jgi:hypothetical protein
MKIGLFSSLSRRWLSLTWIQRLAAGMGIALLSMTLHAQAPADATQAPAPPPPLPSGYSVHESIDAGGHMVGLSGAGSMYDTMVNMQSGPRILGESFTMRALPDNKHPLFDDLTAVSNGWGGDPNNFATLNFSKGKAYEFVGMFRRDRQYFNYDLLGNANIPSGQSIPIGPSTAPTGTLPWPQQRVSPFLYNTVRRMTNADLTILPLSKVSFRAGFAGDVFEGPSLSPSGYQFAGSYNFILNEMQRLSTDDFFGGIDWKPVQSTKLTFEEEVDHFKSNSFFSLSPITMIVQEADGTRAAFLINMDSLTPYTSSSCNPNSMGTTPLLTAAPTSGSLPIINAACAVATSYLRSQPTRILYPTEVFRLQSTSIKNVSMNGNVRYTNANMHLPNYYENFQGLAKTTRQQTVTANASAQRKVMAADYGIIYQATRTIALEDQFTFTNVQQPGATTMTGLTTVSTATTANSETITNPVLTTATGAAGTAAVPSEGSGTIGVAAPDFFGQRIITNDLTASWDASARMTLSLTYRHGNHIIAEGPVHTGPVGSCANSVVGTCGTVTINEDGGIFTAAVRATEKWNVNGSVGLLYNDNAFTPLTPRQTMEYRVHTMFRPKAWATITGAFNDVEHHDNTNNMGAAGDAAAAAAYAGPLSHVDYSRLVSAGAELFPNEHYGIDFYYTYSDVYMADNICYLGGATAAVPVDASTPSGTSCPALSAGRSGYDFGPALDFMHAPTQSGSVAFNVSPVKSFKSNLGYNISAVNGTRSYNDPREVAGSLISTYQSPFVNLAWTMHPGLTWKAEYNFYGYGEGGPSGATLCGTTNPTPTAPVTPVACSSLPLQTAQTISPAGETAPRNYHANMVTLGVHYEF